MKKRYAGAIVLGILVLGGVSFAETPATIEQDVLPQAESLPNNRVIAKPSDHISLSLRNIDIIDALKFFSLKSGFNIVPTQKVTGRVTMNVEDVPIVDVFDIMLRSNSLAYDKRGDIFNVMTEPEYKALYGKNFSDTRQVRIFRLRYAIPEQAYNMLEALKSDIGRLLTEPESGAVMLIDTPEKIKEAETALQALEQKNTIKVFTLKYAKAKEVEDQLKTQLDLKHAGMVKSDDRTNQVIVQTLPERMKSIEDLVTSLDRKTKAVLLDTKIIKIQLSDDKQTGFQWEGLFQMAKQYGMAYVGSYPFSVMNAGVATPTFVTRNDWLNNIGGQVGSYPFSGTTNSLNASQPIPPGGAMHVGMVGTKHDFDTVIKFLQTLGQSKVMASPSLSVVNNQEANIHIGERQAYITTTTTQGTTTTTTSEEVTYVDVGVQLSVTPTINDDGYVTIKVKPQISNIVGYVTSSSNNKIPIIDTNTAETTVLAKDGSTIIIGGLGQETKSLSQDGMPGLSKIPGLGFFFRNRDATTQRVELIIMITPIIFEGDKFISIQEQQRFPVKPPKKFDVFRPEMEGVHGAVGVAPDYMQGDLLLKGFKSYQPLHEAAGEEMVNDNQPKLLTSLSDTITSKGFRQYK